ncbi:hypothetical protein EIN_167470 [Entamoeba invadens IP1]|uniref:Uncharacterized protein n=1 Tax=Entamoeba invadens IP1 TaxID=370355 RepID=A0A0A1TVK2_ENTIV|nr:hypothetical protein EIN_167470 [Entamoeba invadens IP1]ELP84442.1 hypothetical protein EIN_167470 [Entamoeba invadens IP1]|eukprot:XP_004183788.1 hypothetical protein EIN_167470 [Entamoeba invadens IP1]
MTDLQSNIYNVKAENLYNKENEKIMMSGVVLSIEMSALKRKMLQILSSFLKMEHYSDYISGRRNLNNFIQQLGMFVNPNFDANQPKSFLELPEPQVYGLQPSHLKTERQQEDRKEAYPYRNEKETLNELRDEHQKTEERKRQQDREDAKLYKKTEETPEKAKFTIEKIKDPNAEPIPPPPFPKYVVKKKKGADGGITHPTTTPKKTTGYKKGSSSDFSMEEF